MTGSHEVSGSIPLISTKRKTVAEKRLFFLLVKVGLGEKQRSTAAVQTRKARFRASETLSAVQPHEATKSPSIPLCQL